MKSTRYRTKSLLTLSLVFSLGVGIIGLGRCESQDEINDDEANAPTIYTEWPFDADEALHRQEETAETLGIPVEYENEIGMKLRLIPAGEFMMGSPDDEEYRNADELLHRVRITKPYYLGACEVTQGEWEDVMETTPWLREVFVREGDNYPATYVSWGEAQTFCERLSEIDERNYRLPTEAEWEYACRAGSATAFCFGNSSSSFGKHAWYDENARDSGHRHPGTVGKKQSNAWDLHDMHGNVWEWCQDWWQNDYDVIAAVNPTGPTSGEYRMRRGGSWKRDSDFCGSAFRSGYMPDSQDSDLGFRVVCEVDANE